MSEYYNHSKSKSSRNLKHKESKSKRRNKHHQEDSRSFKMESRTPPLPSKRPSIEELIKKRESLKKELKKMTKETNSDHKSNKSSEKHSSSNYTDLHSRKRHLNVLEDSNIIKKKHTMKELSPEHNGDYAQIESEDEETIIEKRRQKRKQLLEKLKTSQSMGPGKDNSKPEQLIPNVVPAQINPSVKETTDMFADIDEVDTKGKPDSVTQDNAEKNSQLTDNWDDGEGYYNIRVGDEINNNRYTIKSILGQGVFANVVRAQDSSQGNMDVAIKIIRNNELMYKTSIKEISILKEIRAADPEHKHHCVKLLTHFMHKGHLCLVLEPLHMDLRCVLKKYGRNHGINMKALISYSRQLFIALRLLKKIDIVHADIKPDNILVNEKKNVLKLCDFGSAAKVDDYEPTPYLVSRFYRAPEIILGIPYKQSVDIWSTACTIYEMATGKIMFTGSSNNKMLKCFMDLKGKIPARLIRKGKFKDQHFNYNNNFLLHKQDEFTGREKVVEVNNITITRDLQKELKKYCKNLTANEEKKLTQLKDMLDKMLILDLHQRPSGTDCLKHPFIQEELKK